MATQRLLVLLLFVVVGAVQGDPTLRRHRRFLDVEQFEDGKSLFEREGFFFPYSKKAAGLSRGSSQSARFLMMKPSSRKTKKKSKGDKEDGYWMDLMSMSMSMPTTPAPQPPAPSPVSVPTSPTTPTPSPFRECNSSPRDEAFLNILVGVTPADELLDPLTPQGAAFQWLVENDPAQVDPCTYNVDQRYALAAFYYATDGPGWTDQGSWLSAESECLWSGVSCEGGLVVSLIQTDNGLAGTVPSEISVLEKMKLLSLFKNKIGGRIPNVLNSFTSLELFDMEDNLLTGPAFVDLTGLDKLESYRVSINQLSGTIPDLTFATSLREVWAAKNRLAGTLPASIGDMANLQSLILYENTLTGSIPDLSGLDLIRLQLYGNLLTSTIPDGLYSNTRLIDLRLDQNRLTGSISTMIGDLTSLVDLRLGVNAIVGTLPAEIARLSLLRYLLVNENQLTGTIRNAFDQFKDLQFVDFSSNALSGTLPSSIFDVPTIEILYFFANDLTGTIPSNFANGEKLRDLYIHENRIMGTVPGIQPGQLEAFTEFRLEFNDIVGTMPASICSLRGPNNETDLVTLSADCAGNPPEIECDCCTACFP